MGTPGTIAAADKMDAVFWGSRARMDEAGTFDKEIWADIVSELESARLSFINGARREVIGVGARLERLPIARPTMPDRADMPDDDVQT